jgi:hypothetical protein
MTETQTPREIVLQLKLGFGDSWPQRLAEAFGPSEKSELLHALLESLGQSQGLAKP